MIFRLIYNSYCKDHKNKSHIRVFLSQLYEIAFPMYEILIDNTIYIKQLFFYLYILGISDIAIKIVS